MKLSAKKLKERARERRGLEQAILRAMRSVYLSIDVTDLPIALQRELVGLERARRRLVT